MKTSLIVLCFSIFSLPLCAQDLRSELQNEMTKNHRAVSYQDAREYLISVVDVNDGKYCALYDPQKCLRAMQKAKMNMEHIWPRSLGALDLPASSDMHHIYMTTKQSNSKRANFPFGMVEIEDWTNGPSRLGIDLDSETVFEPADESKGNVARAKFYFAVRYKMSIPDKEEKVLREWNKIDQVDDAERVRNDRIETIQHNRNLFIDHPELVDSIDNF